MPPGLRTCTKCGETVNLAMLNVLLTDPKVRVGANVLQCTDGKPHEFAMKRPAGFIIDVPITLSVAVRGVSLEAAKEIARAFADTLQPTEQFIAGYCERAGVSITEVSLESNPEDSCDVLDELEPD
jgi:hypothetical protein